MSAEEAVTEGLQTPMDQNAQAAEEAKRMLAELEGEAASTERAQETNGDKKEDTAIQGAPKEREPSVVEETAVKKENYDNAEDEARERREDRGRREYNGRGRGRGRGGHNGYSSRSYRDNIKSDLTTQEVTDNPVLIREQVEFYFSDANLPKDKFLFGLTEGIANKPVELKKLHTFKRMRHFQPFEAIVKALKDSNKVELTDDETGVRRKFPLPEDFFDVIHKESDPRTVYVKGFGQETPSTQFDIEAFFDPYGPTRAVRLRRNDEKYFKGSVFVEFETEDLANAFLAADPKPKYKDRDLQIMGKIEYQDKKKGDLNAGRITSNYKNQKGGKRDHHDRRGSWDHGKRKRDGGDTRDWRTRRDEDQKRGFRDDKRRGDRGDRDSRGYGGGRSKGPETDERGIPTVKSTTIKNDAGRDEALAKAKAVVEADIKKEQDEQKAADNFESTEQDGNADASTKTANAIADTVQKDVEATASKKRAREDDDDGEAGAEREIKKVDTKTEMEPVTVES